MEADQIILYARKYVEDSGYQNYNFTTVAKTVGTNVWTVVAKVPDGRVNLTINDIDGSLLGKTRALIKIVNETINIGENVPVSATFDFELKEKIFIGGKLLDSDSITLVSDEFDSKYLRGFRISVNPLNDKTSQGAYELANRFTNYLSLITGIVVEHKRPLIRKHSGQKTTNAISFTVGAVLAKVQDIDLSKLSKFLSVDSRVHQHLFQLKKGHEALLDNDYATAIRWFYMIIENDGSQESRKYFPLRNVVSHEELDKDPTIKGVTVFGITMNKGDHLNFNDPQIHVILRQESQNLYNIVRPKVEYEFGQSI